MITITLTEKEAQTLINQLNYDFERGDSPAYCEWKIDDDTFYSERERKEILADEEIKTLLRIGNLVCDALDKHNGEGKK